MSSWKAVIFIALCKMVSILPTSIADSVQSSSPCEKDWTEYDQHCYISIEVAVDWRAAASECNRMGGNLPSIHSKQQNDVFINFAVRTGIDYWWTGLHDHEIDGIFVWEDGTDVDFTNWRSSEPYGEYFHSGNCAALSFITDNYGKWYVLPCSRQLTYLCQKKLAVFVTTTTEIDDETVHIFTTIPGTVPSKGSTPCEEGWKHYDQHCFQYQGDADWRRASAHCISIGGNLPSVHSKKENDILGSFADATGVRYFWLGLHDHEIDGVFSWDDGTDVNYSNWRSTEPYGDYLHDGDCTAVSFTGNHIGEWYILPCTRNNFYLCQKRVAAYVNTDIEMDEGFETTPYEVSTEIDYDIEENMTMLYETETTHINTEIDDETETTHINTEMDDETVHTFPHTIFDNATENGLTSCEEGWKQYGNHCFKLEEEHLDWNNASDKCISMGGHLASIHSKEQNDFFEEFAKEAEKTYWWIGLYTINRRYFWEDRTDVDYSNWKPGEPIPVPLNTVYCVAKSFNFHYFGNWYTLDCWRKLPYMCQKSMSTSVIPTKENADIPVYIVPTTPLSNVPRKDLSPCEDGWKLYEHHCFKLEENYTDWSTASAECKGMGGYLASIHSKEQNDFFEEITKETGQMRWWLGLHDLNNDIRYVWDDGTDVDYTNWRPSQPKRGNCAAQTFYSGSIHGQWFSARCKIKYEYICQKKTRTVTTSTELGVITVTRSAITSTELDITTVTRSVITSKEMDERTGYISVTTHAITLTIVIVFMALLAALLYYKRPWIEEKRSKVATVLFRKTERVSEPCTELIIEPEKH